VWQSLQPRPAGLFISHSANFSPVRTENQLLQYW
jgi:hypothetical protein